MLKLGIDNYIDKFKENRKIDPVIFSDENIVYIKLYKIEREKDLYQGGKRNILDKVVERSDFSGFIFDKKDVELLETYISCESFSISKNLKNFLELQSITNNTLSLTNNLPKSINVNDVHMIDVAMFKNYLDHLNVVKQIKTKVSKIVKDKFNKTGKVEKVDTSAIFSNVGYIVKGFEGKYISLSKGDRTFIKNFMDAQIKEGAYKITMKETLPLYKESIKEILNIGYDLLKLNENKSKLKSFSIKYYGREVKQLESCWQLYFEKYFRVMLMNYKEFYSHVVFKEIVGYDKDSIPDFLAVDIYNNIDIIEIKTHKTILFRKEGGRDSYYPSHDLNKSIFQLNKYLDLKSENIDLLKIDNQYTKSLIENDKVYRPRGILIISSKDHLVSEKTNDELTARLEKEIKKLKTTYNNIDVILFDELLENLQNYLNYIEISLEK
jgi:hypothetical protein